MYYSDMIHHTPKENDKMELVQGSVGLCWRPKIQKEKNESK